MDGWKRELVSYFGPPGLGEKRAESKMEALRGLPKKSGAGGGGDLEWMKSLKHTNKMTLHEVFAELEKMREIFRRGRTQG